MCGVLAGNLTEHDERDGTGEKSHKAIYGVDAPCPFCCLEVPETGESVSLRLTSPLDGHIYYVSAMMIKEADGSKERISLIRDITAFVEGDRN